MKTLLKVVAGFVGLLLVGAATLYIGWFRHPSPEEVCENVQAVARKEGGDAAAKAIDQKCVSDLQPPSHGTTVPYATRMKCMKNAKSLAEIQACERKGT